MRLYILHTYYSKEKVIIIQTELSLTSSESNNKISNPRSSYTK